MVNNMKRYIKEYTKEIQDKLKGRITHKDTIELKNKILFFSHERLVHLLVTLFFTLFTLIFVYFSLTFENVLYIVITLCLLVILVFYILHYYFLENSVQNLYKLYDEMLKKEK